MEVLQSILSMSMLLATLRLAIPLTLASIGGVLCERSGIINLGIEGMMLMGSFGAVIGSHISGNPWVGVLFGCMQSCALNSAPTSLSAASVSTSLPPA